ncbi:MAG: PepSY-like domain-containing protein [Lewinellaceae bacterium]|nr:PepSY-like domain-containing protein [Lewinellaceae bacterium]
MKKNGDWEAEFEQDEVEMSANFNTAGQWLETETEIKVADLPAAVRTALQGKKVKEAAKIMRADGTTVYEAEVKRKDMLFDDSGKMLSEEKD